MTEETEEHEEESESEHSPKRRGIYLLPNLFTTAALFSGFYAIVGAMQQKFEIAAVAVFIAMVLDAMDGRIARLTNTQSAFGAEYDSLSDLVSFGLAPALLMYQWSLFSLGKAGWLAAFIYTAAAALRLARFNTQLDTMDKAHFQGLPSPASAAVMVGLIWVCVLYEINGAALNFLAFFITIATGLLMVSNVRYRSFKDLDLKGKVPFVRILAVVLIFVLISIDPAQMLFFSFLIYALSGPLLTLWDLRKKHAHKQHKNHET
ncbi:CDP-diacylglycerol--serine O-phosphatidyltransferase [Candidatus Venteria ishoeyi]|uniref:CDP-diacylglycerol--serine O-phosphatidyltransferase n=1 Tax=Candidatus Venteria ishoeyi TaxID=1899563 RepID=UPI0025A514F1|nr:CDP-diacylglycerol--serine O-phosphatidyltransferase [Candidatus Venteria ishoeyi]MDM8545438.1 CDP-diacylglycerol--serine O-phosphatidyltransferase [Candidatus Venteria ishoeyi]